MILLAYTTILETIYIVFNMKYIFQFYLNPV